LHSFSCKLKMFSYWRYFQTFKIWFSALDSKIRKYIKNKKRDIFKCRWALKVFSLHYLTLKIISEGLFPIVLCLIGLAPERDRRSWTPSPRPSGSHPWVASRREESCGTSRSQSQLTEGMQINKWIWKTIYHEKE